MKSHLVIVMFLCNCATINDKRLGNDKHKHQGRVDYSSALDKHPLQRHFTVNARVLKDLTNSFAVGFGLAFRGNTLRVLTVKSFSSLELEKIVKTRAVHCVKASGNCSLACCSVNSSRKWCVALNCDRLNIEVAHLFINRI